MPIITICRGAFSGVEALASQLGEELGYNVISREQILSSAASAFGVSESEIQAAIMHKPGFLEGRGLKKLTFIHCVRAALTQALQGDNVVYHGEAGHALIEGVPHVMRVRVVGDRESRIKTAMDQCGLVRDKAIQYLRELDDKRNAWLKWVHGLDADDPATFDLMINLARVPVSGAVSIVAETARRDFPTTPESQKLMDDLVLASAARAAIGLEQSVSDDRMQVAADGGVVTISANVRYLANADKVREVVSRLPGFRDIQFKEGTQL
jgi:cytidylate kinase